MTLRYSRCRVHVPTASAMMGSMATDEVEQARRRHAVDQARANLAIEGLYCDARTIADQEAYVRGDIDSDELLERVRRYQ